MQVLCVNIKTKQTVSEFVVKKLLSDVESINDKNLSKAELMLGLAVSALNSNQLENQTAGLLTERLRGFYNYAIVHS
jgi:hypothetical protein